jgi:hypothetical protein
VQMLASERELQHRLLSYPFWWQKAITSYDVHDLQYMMQRLDGLYEMLLNRVSVLTNQQQQDDGATSSVELTQSVQIKDADPGAGDSLTISNSKQEVGRDRLSNKVKEKLPAVRSLTLPEEGEEVEGGVGGEEAAMFDAGEVSPAIMDSCFSEPSPSGFEASSSLWPNQPQQHQHQHQGGRGLFAMAAAENAKNEMP